MARSGEENNHRGGGLPARFPLTATDRLVSAFFSLGADIMLQVELRFAHRLDPERLRRSLQLVLDAEPVLGCRVVFDPHRPYWERLAADDRENFQIIGSASAFDRYKASSIDPARGPALKGALYSGKHGDTVLLKIAHEAADAGGAKDVAYLVASIYNGLKDAPGFRPAPNLSGSRGIDQVLGRLPWHAYPRIGGNALSQALSVAWPRRSHNPPLAPGDRTRRHYVERHIPTERVRRMTAFGRRRGAKLNDMIMAAFFRGLARTGWDGRTALRAAMTVDLRHWHLPRGQAERVCNLSGIEICTLGRDPGKDFAATLERVTAFTRRRKKSWFGLNISAGPLLLASWCDFSSLKKSCERIVEEAIASRALIPLFTNLGPIHDGRLVFDEAPEEAWVIVPTGYPPFFGAGMSGYRGSLTLSVGALPTAQDTVEAVFDAMLVTLPG